MMAKLLLLFCSSAFITGFVNTNNTIGYYAIPDPLIVAFRGGGLRVILNDDAGISVFRFHGSVNQEMKQLYPGTINIETSTKINGRWVLEDRSVKLHAGDVLFYWLFVEKDRLGYVKQPVRFRISELVPYFEEENTEISTSSQAPFPDVHSTATRPTTSEPQPTTSTACPCPTLNTITIASLQSQIDSLNKKLDLITSITALQGQVDFLSKKFDGINTNSLLENQVKNMSKKVESILATLDTLPEVRRLTMSGVIPPNLGSNPATIVRMVIWEKLDLRVNIISAVRNNEKEIVFELKTLQEKIDVLNAAKEKLTDARIVIS